MAPTRSGRVLLSIALGWAWMSAGCSKPAPAPPPNEADVTVTHPIAREVVDWDGYPGYLVSPQTANVAARVSGLVVEAPYKEGALVQQGQVLFVLDPRPFQADLDAKKAAVAQAAAQNYQAQSHFQRYQTLKGTDAISEDDYINAKTAADAAQASLDAAKAAQETSALNLQWANVTAPIAGRIGKIDVTVGNLVNGGSGQATQLTTIVSIDPLYCYVPVPEGAYLGYRTLQTLEKQQGSNQVTCYLDFPGKPALPGRLDFIDNTVETGTGTIQVRGIFHNPGWLIPGLFTSMRIPQGPAHQALLVPQTAMVVEQNERSLLVVGSDNVAHARHVTFGRAYGPMQAVLSGLSTEDQVIIEGVDRAQSGAKVKPTVVPIPESDLTALNNVAASPPPATTPASEPTQLMPTPPATSAPSPASAPALTSGPSPASVPAPEAQQ